MNILTEKESAVIQMALSQMTEELETVSKDPRFPLTPDARRDMADILANAKSAHEKMAKAHGQVIRLDPYQEGDEKEFLTKES